MSVNIAIWAEKFRPSTINECILPDRLKNIFTGIIRDNLIPNMLFFGSAGVGKTTVAKALCKELDLDYIVINGSEQRNIDTLRNDVMTFAASKSMNGKRKVVILDEADGLNNLTQSALRAVIESYANNCSFIFTCNYKNKIITPLHSRCACYDFSITKQEKKSLIMKLYSRISEILNCENVSFDSKVLSQFILLHYPDIRRILNELQGYAKSNQYIDEGILSDNITEQDFNKLLNALSNKDFKLIKAFCYQNSDIDLSSFYKQLYEHLLVSLESQSIPQAILILHDYMYKSGFVFDHELNLLACLIELMANCQFKK